MEALELTALDKLRAIEKRIVDGPDTDEAWQERIILAYLLRPAFEALEAFIGDGIDGGSDIEDDDAWDVACVYGDVRKARAVLAKLEEALSGKRIAGMVD